MKDPCIGCLVEPCCDKLCPEKENYNILVKNMQEQHNDFFRKNGLGAKVTPSFQQHLKRVKNIWNKNCESNHRIQNRKYPRKY
jgi:hypothetical protein